MALMVWAAAGLIKYVVAKQVPAKHTDHNYELSLSSFKHYQANRHPHLRSRSLSCGVIGDGEEVVWPIRNQVIGAVT